MQQGARGNCPRCPPLIRTWFRGSRGHDIALMGLEFIYPALPACLVVCVQKSDFYLFNVFCVVIVVITCRLLCLAQAVFSYFVLHSSKIHLVLTTKVTHLCSLLFRQSDGVNCVVLRVVPKQCLFRGIVPKQSSAEDSILGFLPKQSSAVSGLWMLTIAST